MNSDLYNALIDMYGRVKVNDLVKAMPVESHYYPEVHKVLEVREDRSILLVNAYGNKLELFWQPPANTDPMDVSLLRNAYVSKPRDSNWCFGIKVAGKRDWNELIFTRYIVTSFGHEFKTSSKKYRIGRKVRIEQDNKSAIGTILWYAFYDQSSESAEIMVKPDTHPNWFSNPVQRQESRIALLSEPCWQFVLLNMHGWVGMDTSNKTYKITPI